MNTTRLRPTITTSLRKVPRGSSLVEALAGFAIVLPVFLIGIDLLFVLFGFMTNCSVCNQAARAASIGPPSALVKGAPLERAQLSVDTTPLPRGLISVSNVDVQEQVKLPQDAEIFAGNVEGQVTVTTRAIIMPPFLLRAILGEKCVTVEARQTYPYTWTLPPRSDEVAQMNKQVTRPAFAGKLYRLGKQGLEP